MKLMRRKEEEDKELVNQGLRSNSDIEVLNINYKHAKYEAHKISAQKINKETNKWHRNMDNDGMA